MLYDEVNDLLPEGICSSDELDSIFSLFGSAGIEVIDSEQKFQDEGKKDDKRERTRREGEFDFGAITLDKTNDPVRMYLREMGTVPLLSREGEVEIAKRIEHGQKVVLKALSRSPLVVREILNIGDQLKKNLDIDSRCRFVQRRRAYRRAAGRKESSRCSKSSTASASMNGTPTSIAAN